MVYHKILNTGPCCYIVGLCCLSQTRLVLNFKGTADSVTMCNFYFLHNPHTLLVNLSASVGHGALAPHLEIRRSCSFLLTPVTPLPGVQPALRFSHAYDEFQPDDLSGRATSKLHTSCNPCPLPLWPSSGQGNWVLARWRAAGEKDQMSSIPVVRQVGLRDTAFIFRKAWALGKG